MGRQRTKAANDTESESLIPRNPQSPGKQHAHNPYNNRKPIRPELKQKTTLTERARLGLATPPMIYEGT